MIRIPAKYARITNTVLMSIGMSGVMSFAMGVMNQGLETTLQRLPISWAVSFMVALPASLLLSRAIGKMNTYLINKERKIHEN